MNEILRFMQKRDERTDGRKAFYNLPTTAFGWREIKIEQAISACEQALCQLCVLNFRVEVKEGKDTKVVPCKWYSEVKY